MNFSGVVRINKLGMVVIIGIVIFFTLYTFSQTRDESSTIIGLDRILQDSVISRDRVKHDPFQISLREILIAAVDVAQRGGLEVVKVRNSTKDELAQQLKGHTKEGAKDRVTQGDFKSHHVMYYGMRKGFPRIKVISEEHTASPDLGDIPFPNDENEEITKALFSDEVIPSEDITVWIDPLDATQEYTENLVQFVTTMVCVAVKGVPIIGVIHRPFTRETFWALVGHGTSPNLDVMMNRRPENLSKSSFRIIVSRSHAGEVHNLTKSIFKPNEPIEILQAAGAGYKVLEVVSGRADVYLHVTAIKKWDLCAGSAILSAVDGKMTTVSGGSLDYSSEANALNTKGVLGYVTSSALTNQLTRIELPA